MERESMPPTSNVAQQTLGINALMSAPSGIFEWRMTLAFSNWSKATKM